MCGVASLHFDLTTSLAKVEVPDRMAVHDPIPRTWHGFSQPERLYKSGRKYFIPKDQQTKLVLICPRCSSKSQNAFGNSKQDDRAARA